MASSKVVRVEDVLEAGLQNSLGTGIVSASELLSAGGEGLDGSLKPIISEAAVNGDGENISTSTTTSERETTPEDEEELKEKVYELPENWPRIRQLERPASCLLTMSRMPCVRKAVSHLELIQNIIDEWFKRVITDSKSAIATSDFSQQNVPRKQLRFRDPSTRSTATPQKLSSEAKSRVSSSTLSVTGLGIDVPDPEADAQYWQELGGIKIPYLGAEDVIDEVMTLLARLETDRQDTHRRFLQEVEAGNNLKKKIDEMSLRRLKELPLLVQREHEACVVDLSELNWHVAYTTRARDKALKRRKTAENRNVHLIEEITFIKQHIPLVEEKLVLELEAMDRIKKAQAETNQELMTAKQHKAKTEQKAAEAQGKAETERGHIKRELDSVRENLNAVCQELSEAKKTYERYTEEISVITQKLEENVRELQALETKEMNIKETESMQAMKVHSLQAEVTDAEFQCRLLVNENEKAAQHLQLLKTQNANRLKELESRQRALEEKLRTLRRHNDQLAIEIADVEEKIKECDEQQSKDDKNIRRIQREQEKVNVSLSVTLEEHNRVSTINQHICQQLETEQEKAFRAEEALKNAVETLRRQVKEEVHTRTILNAKINSEKAEMEKTRAESGKKQTKAEQVVQDVESALQSVQQKVEMLRKAKEKRTEQKATLQTQIDETKKQHTESLNNFEAKLRELTPHHDHLKLETHELSEELERMKWKSDMMKKKIEEMDGAEKAMAGVIERTETTIKELEEKVDEGNKDLEAHRQITDNLKMELNTVLERIKDAEKRHNLFMKDRTAVLHVHDAETLLYIEKNKELAARYRQLQNEFLITKEQYLKKYDDQLKLEATIGDVKQLKGLQSKLHGALTEYFKLSGLYNQGELSRLQHVSNFNGWRVGQLQQDLDEALHLIAAFLHKDMNLAREKEKVSCGASTTESSFESRNLSCEVPPIVPAKNSVATV